MKAKEFVNKFTLNLANNPTDRAFIVNDAAVNEFAYSQRLYPVNIEYTVVDDFTLEVYWYSQDWDNTDDLISEITRYCKVCSKKANLEEDVLLILKIRSKTRDYVKNNMDIGPKVRGAYLGLTDRGNEIMNQTDTHKIIIPATVDNSTSKHINKIPKDQFMVYTLSGDNVHWFYQATGKNYARAALIVNSDGSASINRDDLGSIARLIGIGAKVRGDGNTLWSSYSADGPIKCFKLTIETQFGNQCYVDISTLTDFSEFDENLFERIK